METPGYISEGIWHPGLGKRIRAGWAGGWDGHGLVTEGYRWRRGKLDDKGRTM